MGWGDRNLSMCVRPSTVQPRVEGHRRKTVLTLREERGAFPDGVEVCVQVLACIRLYVQAGCLKTIQVHPERPPEVAAGSDALAGLTTRDQSSACRKCTLTPAPRRSLDATQKTKYIKVCQYARDRAERRMAFIIHHLSKRECYHRAHSRLGRHRK